LTLIKKSTNNVGIMDQVLEPTLFLYRNLIVFIQ
jgi:hypothetical protein